MKITAVFFKERRREIILYALLLGTFAAVLYLYDIRTDAAEYAFLLSAVWLLLSGAWDYVRFTGNHKKLSELEQKIDSGEWELPDAGTLIEEDYQRIAARLYEARVEEESAGRIARQEMMDYYGMWVHQIKTPIAAMHVLMQAVGECEVETKEADGQEGTSDPEENLAPDKQYTKEMKLELFKIEQYVEMVLTYLRMGDMSSDLSFEICSLDAVIRQAVRKYSQMFILKKIKLSYAPVETNVLTDEKWLVFVLEQILSNALKYTRSEGSRQAGISIYMEDFMPENGVSAGNSSEKKCLVIEDTGIGISPEDLPRVFEKGFTGYNGRTDKKSTGIGLYLCKSVMDKLRHQIWIASEVGRGTKVYLYLERKKMKYE